MCHNLTTAVFVQVCYVMYVCINVRTHKHMCVIQCNTMYMDTYTGIAMNWPTQHTTNVLGAPRKRVN